MFDRFELIRNGYGSTEAGLTSSKIISPTNVEDASAGPPHDQVRVEIVDLENNPLPTDAEGIVRIRTKGQVSGYVGELVVNAEAFQDGWFYPGDLGRMSGGELYITGRSNDQLNIGGVKINAIAIDDALMSVSGVRDAICFANADTDALPALAALLVIAPKADADQTVREARRILRSKFGLARTPKEFFVMDAAPRNENGKAQRHLAAAAVRGLKPIP
jgi:acyl-coenzyme A synthetase/AMP-(fatty) acid ligase